MTYPTAAGQNILTMYGGSILCADRYGTLAGSPVTVCSYRSQTTFASITDGLSNTFIIGEKTISKLDLKSTAAGDGNIYYGDNQKLNYIDANYVRVVQHKADTQWYTSNSISKKGANEPTVVNGTTMLVQALASGLSFGSWHSSVTLFCMGDGSVKQIRTNGDNNVLYHCASRNDGLAVNVDDH
jgi:hypothetical protein